jgi:hypothetical protein
MLATAFIGGAVIASAVLLLRVRGRHDVLAFTPLLLLGSVAAHASGFASLG